MVNKYFIFNYHIKWSSRRHQPYQMRRIQDARKKLTNSKLSLLLWRNSHTLGAWWRVLAPKVITCFAENRDQSNSGKSGIVVHPPNSSFVFARWQHRAGGLAAWLGSDPYISPSPGGQRPHLTQCVTGPHKCTCQMASEYVERFQQGARMWQTTDRQTDGEICIAITRLTMAVNGRVYSWHRRVDRKKPFYATNKFRLSSWCWKDKGRLHCLTWL